MKVKVGVLGSTRGTALQGVLEAVAAGELNVEIVLVLSNKADAAGLDIARGLGVAADFVPTKPFGRDRQAHERALDAKLVAAGAELVCLAGYMRLLTPYLVGRWAGRMLNIHPSLLPALPGLDTHQRAIDAGAAEHGCTVHLVTEGMDEGPVLGQARVPVLAGDSEETLAARVLAEEHRLYPAMLAEMARKILLSEGQNAP